MRTPIVCLILPIFAAATLTACGSGGSGDPCQDTIAYQGTQANYDSAYATCFSTGSSDACNGVSAGENYNQLPHDVCADGLFDEGIRGCEDGYQDGFDEGC